MNKININWNDWDIEEKDNESKLTDKEFVKFLYNNNDYDIFIYNINKSLESYCDSLNQNNYISRAFTWDYLKEG
jgi:hypothetical protein